MRDLICDLCKNKKFSGKSGMICGLTMKKPTVRYTCEFYEKDELLDQRYEREDAHSKAAELRKNDANPNKTTNRFISFWSEVIFFFSGGR